MKLFVRSIFILALGVGLGNQLLNAQVINALSNGADPTGQKDNSEILNRVIDSLSLNGGGTILIPTGKYLLNNAVILKSNIHLKGEGFENSHLFRDPKKGNWEKTKAQGLITTDPARNNENIMVSNLSVDADYQKDEENAKGGICLRNCKSSTIKDVRTIHTWHGVAFYDFKGEISNNLIDNVHSIKAQAFTTKNNSGRPRGILTTDPGSKVINSKSTKAGTGFYAYGRNITFENCKAEFWFTDNGYYLIVDNLTVKNCEALGGTSPEKGFGSGFAIGYKKGALIENNLAENCDNYGFRIHVPQSDTRLINNRAVGCGNGFGIENASHPFPEVCSNIYMKGNVALNSGIHGFLFRQMVDSEIIKNRAINGNQRMLTLSTRGAFALKDYLADNTFIDNYCEDNQSKKTQLYGFYDFSVNDIKSSSKKGINNTIIHRSKSGKDVF